MSGGNYILEGKETKPASLMEWAEWMRDVDKRRIALDEWGGAIVSTVFLGIDHDFYKTGTPILFETLVSLPDGGEEMFRYCTYDEAVTGHNEALARVKEDSLTIDGSARVIKRQALLMSPQEESEP